MLNYKVMLEQKAKMPDVLILQKDIDTADSWEVAYWIGRFAFEQASSEADKLIMSAYEKAFELGLNIRRNREHFLVATQQIAKIYFQFRKYDEAINKLLVLRSYDGDLPDWVNLYYVSAYIQTENVLYWAESPEFLFDNIERIDETNAESVNKRKYLFLEFLDRICEMASTADISRVNINAILSKAAELGVDDSRECVNFKVALGLIPGSLATMSKPTSQGTTDKRNISIYEQVVSELNKKLSEFQAIIDRQTLFIERQAAKEKLQQKEIESLQVNKIEIKQKLEQQGAELKAVKEEAKSWKAKCDVLESQLSGSEDTRKQLENNAITIGVLQTDVEDLKVAVTVSRDKNLKLKAEIDEKQEIINKLEENLIQKDDELQNLYTEVKSLKSQLEVLETALRDAERKNLDNATEKQPDNEDKDTALENDKSLLPDLLDIGGVLQRRKKILIIGGSQVKAEHLRGKLKNLGFKFSNEQLEFELEYDDVKSYASRINPWNSKYAGIIVGPCPHKAKDIEGYSSFIEKLKSEEGYPPIVEARDKSNVLKISKESIGEAMYRMSRLLHSSP